MRFGVEGIYDQVQSGLGKLSVADVAVAELPQGSASTTRVVNEARC